MSQRSQVSRVALCMLKVKVLWVSQSVTRSPIELFWTAKHIILIFLYVSMYTQVLWHPKPCEIFPFNALIVLNVRAAFHRNQTFTFSWQKYFAIQRFPCSDLTIPNWKAAPRNFSCGQPLATMGRPRGAWQILPMGQNKQEWIIIEALW